MNIQREGYLKYYKEPNENFAYNEENMKEYLYWICERMNIWHKRVVLQQPRPWTEDEILQKYKFTNAIRDLDRLSIFYINNLLNHLEDTEHSKKELLLNTMIYRLFCRQETWETFGYLHLDNWEAEWSHAKEQLRKLKKSGASVFTSAYYVNGLRCANNNPETCHNKTENAICLIDIWYNKLDEIYQDAIVNAQDMKEQLKVFSKLPAVGPFTAYEWACDLCLAFKYTGIPMVAWDDDSYTNVGPGAKRGIEWLFKGGDRGGLSDLQILFWIRKHCKELLDKFGLTLVLPEGMTDINCRVIEHSACEYQKYKKAKEGEGRPKVTFTQNNDVDTLVLPTIKN